MRRKLTVIVLIIAMLVGILHTGKINNDQEEETKRLSYYQTENVYVWYTDESQTEFFTNAAVAFHEQNENIRVIPTYVDSNELIEKAYEASVKGENFPDVFVTSNYTLEKVYLSGLASKVRDNSNVLNRAHFSQTALDSVTYGGDIIGYPFMFETSVLLYNKTYLLDWIDKANEGNISYGEGVTDEEMGEQADPEAEDAYDGNVTEGVEVKEVYTLESVIPNTFEDIKTFADLYEAPEGVEGVFKWDVSDIFYNYLFAGKYMIFGGDAGDDSNNISIINDQSVASANYYQSLNQFFSIDATESDYESVIEDFFKGKMVFTIVTSDSIERVNSKIAEMQAAKTEKENERDELLLQAQRAEQSGVPYEEYLERAEDVEIPSMTEYGFALIPDLTKDLDSRSLSVTEALVVNGFSEVKDSANKFAAFVTTDYASQIYTRTGRLAASTDAGYTDEAFVTFQEEYAESISLPKMVEVSNLWVQLEINFIKIWEGESTEERLRQLENQIKSQLVGTGEKNE